MKTTLLLTIALLASPAHAADRLDAADRLAQQIDARVRQYAEAGLFSGVVLVAHGDRILYEKAFGLADRTFDVPNTITTKFHIASVSKPITAAAVLLLADRGKLELQWPVSRILPEFPNGDRITIEEVLTHYSGLDDTSSNPDFEQWSRFPQTPASLVERLAKLPLRSEPNQEYRYSNANYHLLSLIIEKVSGQPYGEFLRDAIFRPLGMTSSGHHGNERDIIPRLANGYLPKAAAEFEKPSGFDWTSKTGNGSLYTTAGDLLRFHRALQHGTLLKPETARASLGFDRKDRTVGMFWFPGTYEGHRFVSMSGSSPGYKAYLDRFVDDDAVTIVLSNLYLASPQPIARDIAALMYAKEPKLEPVPAPVARTAAELDRFVGTYQFPPDFYAPNQVARVERRGDSLAIVYTTGSRVIPLIATKEGFFDRSYWSFVRFEDGKLIYRNGKSEFAAPRMKD